jgi:hypothetical protein
MVDYVVNQFASFQHITQLSPFKFSPFKFSPMSFLPFPGATGLTKDEEERMTKHLWDTLQQRKVPNLKWREEMHKSPEVIGKIFNPVGPFPNITVHG